MSDNEPAQHSPNYGGWASFEVEIRARRYARCLQAAQAALLAGNIEEAKDWIAEGRLVSFASPELDELERRISTRSDSSAAPVVSGSTAPLGSLSAFAKEELDLRPEPQRYPELEPEREDEPAAEPAPLAPAVRRNHFLTQDTRSTWHDRVAPSADVFRLPDPGFESSASDVPPPGSGVLFGSSGADERREVSSATVLLGMAAAALLVGGISFGLAQFLSGQPLDHLFQVSRDEASAPLDSQPAPRPAPQASTPPPQQPSPSPEPPVPERTEPKPSDVAVALMPSAEPRPTDGSPSPAPAATPEREAVASASASRAADPVRQKPPDVARDNAARGAETSSSVVRPPRTASAAPERPLSGGRLILPSPAPSVAPEAPPVRPFEPLAEVPTVAGTSGSLPATPPAVTPPASVSPVSSSPSPVPASPAPTPFTRSTAESRAEETAMIRAVLARYEAAYNRLDARAASAVWPRVNEGALDRAFSGLLSQRVALGLCDIAVIGDVGGASCNGKARWEPRIGGGVQTADRSWKFNLRKSQDGWKIEDILVR